ncbi:MAG: nuclear transport factor 2 family protein [Defluviitaleaceae bacterium]|nr:nuclear transport factor 2 family protein [Defluviitaleaceae bacterium]MCL2200067.1 nuclear transport factor 2 family protein [Defluviitaleaceae bacterium]
MNKNFLKAVVEQDADALRRFFTPDAVICWHDSNEQFTVEEYIRANCEYPGDWGGEVQRTEEIPDGIVMVSKIFSAESTHFIVSFAKLTDGKIARLDEYYSDYGEAPEWRKQMKIGRQIGA